MKCSSKIETKQSDIKEIIMDKQTITEIQFDSQRPCNDTPNFNLIPTVDDK